MATCKEANVVASKVGAKVILQAVLGLRLSEDELGPDLPEDEAILETVEVAASVRAVDEVSIEKDEGK